jgi:hypothetical protein
MKTKSTAEKYHLIDDTVSQSEEYPGFKKHRHDQSILSILCFINKIPQNNDNYSDNKLDLLLKDGTNYFVLSIIRFNNLPYLITANESIL